MVTASSIGARLRRMADEIEALETAIEESEVADVFVIDDQVDILDEALANLRQEIEEENRAKEEDEDSETDEEDEEDE